MHISQLSGIYLLSYNVSSQICGGFAWLEYGTYGWSFLGVFLNSVCRAITNLTVLKKNDLLKGKQLFRVVKYLSKYCIYIW